jgi:hypothetical protein
VLICDLRLDMMGIETASIKHSARRGAARLDACAQ